MASRHSPRSRDSSDRIGETTTGTAAWPPQVDGRMSRLQDLQHHRLYGPDPSAPRHRVLGENYRVLREGVDLKELPGGDIRVLVQVAAQEQPTPSTEQEEDCLELCMNKEPTPPPPTSRIPALPRRPISSRIGPKLRSVVVKKN